MVLHNSMKLWADGSMKMKWCLEKLFFFFLSRGLMLLTNVSLVLSAWSSLCAEICVFMSLPSSVTFVRRGNVPSYGLREHKVWIHSLPELGAGNSAPAATAPQRWVGALLPLLWALQIWCWLSPLLTGSNTAMLNIFVLLELKCVLYSKSQNSDLGYFGLYIVCGTIQTTHSCEDAGKICSKTTKLQSKDIFGTS